MSDATIDLSLGRKQNHDEISVIDFPCPACTSNVKGNRGYYVEHAVTVKDVYGLENNILCPASNTKIKAALRSLQLKGTCENCNYELTETLTETYPGGLRIEAGFLEVTCAVCDGRTVAVCDHCGGTIHQKDGAWLHATDSAECPNQVIADDEDDDEELDSEFFAPATKEPLKGEPVAGTIRSNPLHKVIVTDDFTITPSEDEDPHQDPEV